MPFEIFGIANEIAKITAASESTGERAKRAVEKGAKYLAECLQGEVPVDKGHLKASIKASKVKYDAADGFHSDVGPVGNDPVTGEPLAKIGNIVEYGHSDTPAQPWFAPTLARERDTVIQIMDDEFNKGV